VTIDELRAELARVNYKPGWRLSIWLDEHEGPVLRIVAPVNNSYHPDQTIDLGIDTYISPNDAATPETFLKFVNWRLDRVASHEHREWFQVDGVPLNDPHAADATCGA
jgi:hypothetical protein